jgi:hypothetical protein
MEVTKWLKPYRRVGAHESCAPRGGRIPEVRKIARYTLEALLVLVPLVVVIYFVAYPDKFDAFLDWMVRRH